MLWMKNEFSCLMLSCSFFELGMFSKVERTEEKERAFCVQRSWPKKNKNSEKKKIELNTLKKKRIQKVTNELIFKTYFFLKKLANFHK